MRAAATGKCELYSTLDFALLYARAHPYGWPGATRALNGHGTRSSNDTAAPGERGPPTNPREPTQYHIALRTPTGAPVRNWLSASYNSSSYSHNAHISILDTMMEWTKYKVESLQLKILTKEFELDKLAIMARAASRRLEPLVLGRGALRTLVLAPNQADPADVTHKPPAAALLLALKCGNLWDGLPAAVRVARALVRRRTRGRGGRALTGTVHVFDTRGR